jgi:hypothetical protein
MMGETAGTLKMYLQKTAAPHTAVRPTPGAPPAAFETSGVGEVNLGPIAIPNAATHWTVTWSYNGSDDVSQSISPPVVDVQIDVENGPDPANADSIDPPNIDPASKGYPEVEPSGSVSGHGRIVYCSNACEASFGSSLTTRYWLIMDVCAADGAGPLPLWTVKVSYTTHSATVVLPALHLAERGGPNGLSNCFGHLT